MCVRASLVLADDETKYLNARMCCTDVLSLASDLRVGVEQSSFVLQGNAGRPKPAQVVPKSTGKCLELADATCGCRLQ